MKNLLLLLLLLPALAAAKVPDEEDIQNKTMDAESPFYYPSLMMRYNAGDETLTDESYHLPLLRLRLSGELQTAGLESRSGQAAVDGFRDSDPDNRPSKTLEAMLYTARMRWPAIRSAPRSST